RAIAFYGWRQTMVGFGILVATLVTSLAVVFLRPAPGMLASTEQTRSGARGGQALGLPQNTSFGLLASAACLCCVSMAMPTSHIVALCGDIGLAPTTGAVMLAVLLACAFVSRQIWGWISDRIGGLTTVLVASLAQAMAIAGFIASQDEVGLLAVSAA